MEDMKTAFVNQGMDYIIDHRFEKISVEQVAGHCCYSPYYYNRVFRSVTGRSIYGFVRQVRLETAAFQLIRFPHFSITRVAADLGYSPSNFSVLFKDHFGLSPSRFRTRPKLGPGKGNQKTLERIRALRQAPPKPWLSRMDRQVFFEQIPEMPLVYQRFYGNFRDLPRVWEEFCIRIARDFPGASPGFYGISYNDPLIAGTNHCLYDLCAAVPSGAKENWPNRRRVGGGAFLCCRYEGHVRDLGQLYNDLLGVWIPLKGVMVRPGLCFERYYGGAAPEGVVMDLCIPVVFGQRQGRAQIQK